MDDTYSNKSWQIVGQGLFELREVNQMERELFAFLGYVRPSFSAPRIIAEKLTSSRINSWNVVVRDEELELWVHEVVGPYEAERELARSLAIAAQEQQRKSMEDRKRRRDVQAPTPSPSTSRSPSPNTLRQRHRNASEVAMALLRGHPNPSSASSSSASSLYDSSVSPSGSSTRSSHRRSRPEYRTSSPYSRSSSRAPSTACSSYASSPTGHGHGMHTPISPCTPAGPLTPETTNEKAWPTGPDSCEDVGAEAAAKLAAYAALHQPYDDAESIMADPASGPPDAVTALVAPTC